MAGDWAAHDRRLVTRDQIVTGVAFAAPGAGATLLHVPDVPPGRYRVDVSGAIPDETLTLEAGREAWPIWSWKAGSPNDAPEFTLVTPVHSLRVIGSSTPARARQVRLFAVAPFQATSSSNAVAIRVTRYGRWFVYSLDRWSHLETGGFWTTGHRTTQIVVADIDGMSASYALQLEAGPRDVAVRIGDARGVQDIALAAGQRTQVVVPAASVVAPLAISVQGGFDAASAFANRADRRRLGVWVSIASTNGR